MKSNNSTFTGIMLLILLWLTYSILTGPTEEERQQQQAAKQAQIDEQLRQDSLAQVKAQTAQAALDSVQNDTTLTAAQKDSLQITIKQQQLGNQFGIFTAAAAGTDGQTTLENDKLKITFNNKGGKISKVEVKGFLQYNQATEDPYDKEPLVLMNNPNNKFDYYIPLTGTSRGDISTGDLYFEPKLEGNTLRLRAYANDKSQYIEQKYTINDNYVVDYQLTLEGINEVMPRNQTIKLDWYTHIHKIEKNPHYEATMTTVYFKSKDESFDYCDCRSTNSEQLENPVEWISQSQQFFNTTLFSKEGTSFSAANVTAKVVDADQAQLKELGSLVEFATKDQKSAAYDMQFYIGPNDYSELVTMGNEFERIIPFGWSIFGFISRSLIRPLFNFFAMFISNYGIIILLLTFLIRLALFPLQYKMILNGVKMSVMKPEMEAMRAKHKDDPAGMQAAQMKMYQDYGLNPLGGCLPMLMTMPIWIALYRFFPSSIAFRQKGFLWADDLVSYDSIFDFGHIPFIYDIYGDHVSLFTLLWMISMFAFLWYNSKQMDMTAAGGGANMKMMKYMQFSFPVLFFFALNSWAAGLTAYMLFSNLLNIAQTFITKNVLINKDKLRAELLQTKEDNKNKPKKEGFMAKYQELLAEQQKEMERKKKQGK
ncbi:membrane protein insertase YidC [Aureispira anguillae]|uniref:Membrane protein insertase YidC n=1 Tax=Aureispira anguillae TaxID=2864201 RepID=A0A915YG97_9BACT|nr:membrane protein insertase YidC [Aureispira anguillae]BDS12598.1 membrane protein insertase YidC [Aureispira anguillae]